MTQLAECEEKKNGRIYKILIVDDEKSTLILLHTALKRARQFKSDIRIAENSSAALAELEKQNFDLVISDYSMPGMNGIEFLMKVKEQYPDTVRILLTGYSDMSLAKEAINKADVHFYLEKPWDNNELKALICEALDINVDEVRMVKKSSDTASQDLPLGLIPIASKDESEKD